MKGDKKTDSRSAEQGEDRLNWRYQDKAYNESFKKWRRKKQDSVGFYFVEKPGRLTYQDGVGFISDYPEAREAETFRKVLTMLGFVLVYRAVVDIFFMIILPIVMEKLGFDVHFSFFAGQRYGSSAVMTAIDIASQLAGRILPAAILVRHLEIPFSVMIPTRITNKSMFHFSVPAALLAAGVGLIMSYFYGGLLEFFGIDASGNAALPCSAGRWVYIILVQILIVPIISELCTHGVILQIVRQFGDGTALCITSLIIAASSYDITKVLFTAVMSFVIGYFVIRTGSVVTGIIMRVTARICIYALYFLECSADFAYRDIYVKAFVFITLTIGLVSTVKFLYSHSDRFTMMIKPSYMSFGRKILETATSIPMVIWFTLTFLATVFNIKFKF